jgi:nucleoside diphosphate kinase
LKCHCSSFNSSFGLFLPGEVKARSLVLVKPAGLQSLGQIISAIEKAGLTIAKLKMVSLTAAQVDEALQQR